MPAIFCRTQCSGGYRFFDRYAPGTNCRAWLLTILYNNFRSTYRSAGREQFTPTPEDFEWNLEGLGLRRESDCQQPRAIVGQCDGKSVVRKASGQGGILEENGRIGGQIYDGIGWGQKVSRREIKATANVHGDIRRIGRIKNAA